MTDNWYKLSQHVSFYCGRIVGVLESDSVQKVIIILQVHFSAILARMTFGDYKMIL